MRTVKDNGRYARKPNREIRAIVEAYTHDEDYSDAWDADTAVESPQALTKSRGPHKRSGQYLIDKKREFENRLEDERRLARVKL